MIRVFNFILLCTLYLNAQTSYNIFITSFTTDRKDAAIEYTDVLKRYLKLHDINQKVSLVESSDEIVIKIVNFETIESVKATHNKIKPMFKNSFVQEVKLIGLKEIHKKAMDLLKEEKSQEAFDLLYKTYNDNNYDNQTIYLLAKAAKNSENTKEAIFFYEKLLELDPTAHRVRLDLADLLYQDGQYEKANEQFLIVKSANIPVQVEKNIESYKQKKNTEKQKNYNLFASVGYMKDSNVNAGPTVNTVTLYDIEFTLSDDAKRTKDDATTLKAGGSILNSFESFLLSTSINGSSIDYDELDDYDNKTYSITTNPIFLDDKSIYMFPISYSEIDLGLSTDYYLKTISFAPTMKKRISSLFSYSVKLSLDKKSYEAIPTKDGYTYGVSYGFEIIDEDTTAGFDFHIKRNSSEDDIYSYNNSGVSLSYSTSLFTRLTFLGSINFDTNYYDEPEDAFGVKKDEYNLNGSLNFIYDLNFYNSNLTLSWYSQHNSSNIELYKYKRNLAMLSLSVNY